MTDYTYQEGVVPAGALDFSAYGCWTGMGSKDVECEPAQHGKVLGSMVHSGPVNRHDYVERPRGSVYCCPLAGESVCDADGRVYIRAAAHSTGEGRMNNLGITVSVIAIAVAQLLTILLTIGRERDIKELRKRVDELHGLLYEQRLQIVELKAWLAGRNAAQLSRLKSKHEPINEPIANNIQASKPATAPKGLAETVPPRTTEDEAARLGQADSGVSYPSGQAQWPIEDLQRFVARLKAGAPPESAIPRVPELAITPEDLPDTIRPSTTGDELERVTKAINWLKEDADKAREIGASSHGTPAEKKIG